MMLIEEIQLFMSVQRQAQMHQLIKVFSQHYQIIVNSFQPKPIKSFWGKLEFAFSRQESRQDIIKKIKTSIIELTNRQQFYKATCMILALQEYGASKGLIQNYPHLFNNYHTSLANNLIKLTALQKIFCLEKQIALTLIKIKVGSINEKKRLVDKIRSLLHLYKQQEYSFPQLENHGKIEDAYMKIYSIYKSEILILPKPETIQREWLYYELEKGKPNIYPILNFIDVQDSKSVQGVLPLIYQRKYEEAWSCLLKQDDKLKYEKYSYILALIGLHQFKEILEEVKRQILSPVGNFILDQTATFLKARYAQQSEEDIVKSHLKCIQFYQQHQCNYSINYAYRSLIIQLSQGYPYPDCPNQSQSERNYRILSIYEILLNRIFKQNKYSFKSISLLQMSKIFSSVIKLALKKSQPDYSYLIKIRQSYFSGQLTDALIWICAKQYSKAKQLIQLHNVRRKHNDQYLNMIERIVSLMEKNKYEEVRKQLASMPESQECWIETIKARILEMTSQNEEISAIDILGD